MRFFIIHGTGADPEDHWFQWLKEKLEQRGQKVYIPDFPDIQDQSLETWMNTFEDYMDKIDDETVFVAHSVGPAFVMNLLERGIQAKACFFVSAFTGLLDIELDEANRTITDRDFDYETIRSNCEYFKLYHAPDDPYVPLEKAEEVSEKLNANLDIIENGGHLNQNSGYTRFPTLLVDIMKEL